MDAKLKLRDLGLMLYFELLNFTVGLLCIVFQPSHSFLSFLHQLHVEVRETPTCFIQHSDQCNPLTFCVPLSLFCCFQLRYEAIILLLDVIQLDLGIMISSLNFLCDSGLAEI